MYPEIGTEAKIYAINSCKQKSASFSVGDLAKFVDNKFYELTGEVKTHKKLVRSETMCRLDLRRWDFKFESNTQRPYFEGHERPDVVAKREQFIDYFLTRKDNYYLLTDDANPKWIKPHKNPCILLCK